VAEPRAVGLGTIIGDPRVRIVVLILFVVMLGFGIIIPILPLYARSFHVGYGAASLLISSFAFARLVFDLLAGPMVDRFGERATATAGVVFVGMSSILTAWAPTFPLAVVFRGAGGAGSSVLFAALYSYILKVVPKDRMARTLSIFYGTLNIGIIAGGPLGGLIGGKISLRAPLYVYAGMCFASGLLYLRFMPNPEGPASDSGLPGSAGRLSLATIRELMRTPGFVTAISLNLMFFWVVAGGYDTLVPLFGREGLGMSTVGVGAAFGIAVLAEFLVLYPAGSAADRLGRKRVAIPSLAWLGVMLVVTGWAWGPVTLGIAMALLGLGSGSSAPIPAAMLSDVAPDTRSGTAVGVFRFAGDLGFVFGPLAGGFAAGHFGFRVAYALMAVPVLVCIVMVARTPETLRADAVPQRPSHPPVEGLELG
jgi:DHA1 family multidrug resistance protein-like MFS transporter